MIPFINPVGSKNNESESKIAESIRVSSVTSKPPTPSYRYNSPISKETNPLRVTLKSLKFVRLSLDNTPVS